ncbi:MAG TPA: protein kinase [Vicinamibacterales bacterium]|nr:protein kinase [Vicinamibacterales bacterium]
MTTPDRVSEIYHRALDRPPEHRAAFLDEACGTDAALRAEVESRLAYDAGSFLEAPAAVMAEATTMVGRRLGPYSIVAPLGAGGMGEVYRARDTKLGRDVAIKILPRHFTADPERRARFAREARVLATLNHPHIGVIHGVEESDGVTALVLELVEGPTLAGRLERGALPVDDALAVARQIAEALDAAHEKGIVHRDLKPANILLQPAAGALSDAVRVKVLDFGLAKSLEIHDGPTISTGGTAEGRTLGTPAYMSPEQARGLSVDKRTDVWAFGCVLFEMLTGRRAFEGATVTDTLARVLDHDPEWTQLPARTPSSIRTLLHRCLRKDPHKRLHDIADALIELDDAPSEPSAVATTEPPRKHRPSTTLVWIGAAGLGAALVTFSVMQGSRPARDGDPIEFTIDPPENWRHTSDASGGAAYYAVSPDGEQLVLLAHSGSTSKLWVRPIRKPAWKELAGTEGATAPFWSPDGHTIGFIANDQLKTVSRSGGPPVALAPARSGDTASGSWNRSGVILFVDRDGLYKLSSTSRGMPTRVTALGADESGHLWPSFLPDDNHFVYLAQRRGGDELRIGSLSSSGSESLGLTESNAIYASGRLLFARGGALMAQAFDTTTWKLTGDPTVVADQTAVVPPQQRGLFSVSTTGVLAYSRAGRPTSQLTWIDRKGNTLSTTAEPGFYINLDLSPDNSRLAASQMTEPGGKATVDIWILDLARAGTGRRLTGDEGREFDPAWSPDGNYLAFNSDRGNPLFGVWVRRSDGSGDDQLWRQSERAIRPDWSPDGRLLMYTDATPTTQRDLWIMPTGCDNTGCKPLDGERKPSAFLRTNYDETQASFSPDGYWVAYQSNDTGQTEVYVRPFPAGEPHRISVQGGRAARWRRDGRELYYLTPNGLLMAVRISTTPRFSASVPEPLFQTGLSSPNTARPYAVAKDGQRFLIPVPRETKGSMPITVILNWPESLAK